MCLARLLVNQGGVYKRTAVRDLSDYITEQIPDPPEFSRYTDDEADARIQAALGVALPRIEGTAAPGTARFASRQDHVHPASTETGGVTFTQADEIKLDRLSDAGVTLFSGTFTAVADGNDIVAERRAGQVARGAFSGDPHLQRIGIDGDTGNMSIYLTGVESLYNDFTLMIGERHTKLTQRTLAASDGLGNVEFSFSGNFSNWIAVGIEAWALVEALGVATSTKTGLLQPAEFIKINDSIDAAHLHDTPQILNSALHQNDAILFDDASVSDGEGSQLKEITIRELDKRWFSSQISGVNQLPLPPWSVGDRFLLLMGDDVIIPVARQATLFQTNARTIAINKSGINALYAYASTHGTAAFQGKVFVNMDAGQTWNKVWIYTGTAPMSYNISPTGVPGSPRFHEVIGLADTAIVTGTNYSVEFQDTDGSFLEHSAHYPKASWIADSTSTLVRLPGSPEEWAEFGNDDLIPLDKIPELDNNHLPPQIELARLPHQAQHSVLVFDGSGPGVNITTSNRAVTPTSIANTITPPYDLDDSDKQTGDMFVGYTLSLIHI